MAESANLDPYEPGLTHVVVPVRTRYEDWIIPIIDWLEDTTRPGHYMGIWANDGIKMRFFFTESSLAIEFRIRWG